MVKTRRSSPLEDHDYGEEFLSLSSRRSRRQPRANEEVDVSSSSDVTQKCKQDGTNLRARSVNSNNSIAQSRMRRNRSLRMDDTKITSYSPVRTRRSAKMETEQEPLTEPVTIDNIHLAEFEEEDHEFIPRRSMRARKPLYTTMNTNMIVNHVLSALQEDKAAKSIQKKRNNIDEEEEEEDEHQGSDDEEVDSTSLDMYSRIKRRHIKRRSLAEEEEEDTEDEGSDQDSDEESSEEEEEEDPPTRNYGLRQHRRIVQRYEAPLQETIPRKRPIRLFDKSRSPLRRHYRSHSKPLTPIRGQHFKRKHHAAHNRSSTSTDSSDDEMHFERRKKKSMARSRMRCLPMNMVPEDVTGIMKDRQKIGSSLADVDPMNIDTTVTFDCVGGLNQHIRNLKEMVVFPLLYPEVFDHFKMSPPRGVLFHGPPGTGKTLVARALANECRQEDKRVSFFMRKGADCLSKWVGESERQLRLLFDQAYIMRPSIIFFDEIDGLAPVRSSRQDQIHSSIVSTLLALMDGLDSRGEIVVIGATNRIDAIDPALRRPGRFDREFSFPLPSQEARRSILSIHTTNWSPKLSDAFISEVAEKCVGYCGADLKALCTEAALFALRRQYPQIYASKEKLQLDVTQIQMSAKDFHKAMKKVVPAAQRSVVSPGRALSVIIQPLLQNQLNAVLEQLHRVMPAAVTSSDKATTSGDISSSSAASKMVLDVTDEYDDYSEEEGPCIFDKSSTQSDGKRKKSVCDREQSSYSFMDFSSAAYERPSTHRPRLLLSGAEGQGQSSYLGPAVLHHLEKMPVYRLDLPALYSVSVNTPEECCAQIFREAGRSSPSVIYMPNISRWWETITDTTRATFLSLLLDLPPNAPVLILATSEKALHEVPLEVRELFSDYRGEVYRVRLPSPEERHAFFEDLILHQTCKPPPRKRRAAGSLEVLPVVAPPEPRRLQEEELKKLEEREESTLRELRLFLRDVLTRLANEKKFRHFLRPVDLEEVPDYLTVIKNPMDLSTMMNKINMHHYNSGRDMMDDIDLICQNALEYNPDRDPGDRAIRNYACELKDTAYAIIEAEMDKDFEKECLDIKESRMNRGQSPAKTAPLYYRVLPPSMLPASQEPPKLKPVREQPANLKRKNDTPPKINPVSGLTDPFSQSKSVKRKKQTRLRSRWNRGFITSARKKKKVTSTTEGSTKLDPDGTEEVENKEEDSVTENASSIEVEADSNLEPVSPSHDERDDRSNFHQTDAPPSCLQENGPVENGIESNGMPDELEASRHSQMTNDRPCSENDSIKSGEVHRDARPIRSRLRSSASSHSDNNPTSPKSTSLIHSTNGTEHSTHAASKAPDVSNGTDQFEQSRGTSRSEMASVDQNTSGAIQRQTRNHPPSAEMEGKNVTRSHPDDTRMGSFDREETVAVEAGGSPSPRRMTRRMWADMTAPKIVGKPEETTPVLVADHKRLKALLSTVVQRTSGSNVETLERLHCSLSQFIYTHRMEYDKTQLITDMESEVLCFVRM
ncbi:ATPase family AAA domain-containing protein 2-like isoform X2 [Acanthaster planci]|uniref:ATPase family AAA domain-containing protein 2-like isoform X2 n=1 Tax=Acanthaster planci TaxID=133434 RepID=A0A8B7ZAF6_ACAPL|nr:ATPase family AAA domain-containing protein 2-like isoform X2 [Acanthaster planci]